MAGNSEIKEEYTSSLQDLTFNSKPLISVLTILAEENSAHAKDIVEAIETHLSRVRIEVKLPVLYLIDCIIKNVGGPYTALFCQNIVSTFCSVFEQVDERTRAEMFRLRQTWNEVIPPKKLYALDVQITQLDPAWPVTAPPPSSIHFNPKFLKTTTTTSSGSDTSPMMSKTNNSLLVNTTTSLDPKTLTMQQKLLKKQKELLELQQHKLQLELLQTQVKLQEQQLLQNTNLLDSTVGTAVTQPITSVAQNLLLKPEVAKQLGSTSNNKASNNLNKLKTNTHVTPSLNTSRLQNNSGGSRITPVNSNLANARPIRDPRLLRQQQHQQPSSNTINSNVHLESKSKSGTQALDTDNKIVNSKANVRNDHIEHRLVNNKGNIESQGKSKVLPNSSSPKHPHKLGTSSRKTSKFSRDLKLSSNNNSPSDLSTNYKNTSNPNDFPTKSSNRNDQSSKVRSFNKASIKIKKKSTSVHSEKDDSSVTVTHKDDVQNRYDKSNSASFRLDKDGGINRADKKSDKHSKSTKSDKESKLRNSDSVTFKDNKGSLKSRNYSRRNRKTSISPEPNQDVDLRVGVPPEKLSRLQGDITNEKNAASEGINQNMDVDLRQLPAMIAKKRPSSETQELGTAKKSKTEIFHVLFGREDTDLRQLQPPKIAERPPTPPPPIISEKIEKPKPTVEKKELPVKSTNLDALRVKLANAVNQDKLKEAKESNEPIKEKTTPPKLQLDMDMRKSKLSPDNSVTKLIISPADEEVIKTGNMTKAQKNALVNKILAQIETQKLREAQKKESESITNVSLQPISDDEFEPVFSESESDEELGKVEDKDNRVKDDRIVENRASPITTQISQLEDIYPKYPRAMDHRDPRRGRLIRNRHRPNWEPLVPMVRPGIRPNFRPPMDPRWRGMGPPPIYPNYGPEQMGPNIPPHLLEQGNCSPNNFDIPALEYAHPDSYKFITIDNEPREIRYYDETAIVFMNVGDPREITFHNGSRRICFDGEPNTLKFNSPYEEISIKGNIHRVRLGAPSREIFIDGKGYECYFDQKEKTIELDGNTIVIQLEPPPPQVNIGQEKRLDLVAGKVQLVIDAKNMFTVFLDAKLQTFELHGVSHTLKFIDSLRAVLINDVRFPVEFGGLPKSIMLHNRKHFIRFSVLPKGIKPGHVNIKDMEIVQLSDSPKNFDENSQDTQSSVPVMDSLQHPVVSTQKRTFFDGESPERNSNSPYHFQHLMQQQNFNNLDMLSSVMASSLLPNSSEGGYKVENAFNSDSQHERQRSNPSTSVTASGSTESNPSTIPFNINALFQRLVATGIVTTATPTPVSAPAPTIPTVVSEESLMVPLPKLSRSINNVKNMKPVLFNKPETLKIRRQPLISLLYMGMQCSSCGMRFPPEHSMYYSQHLDWHFRQNRKGKKSMRKATSRRWYYNFSDWKNYEEIEDLEEREKSYFENQQNQGEGNNDEGEEEIEIPCVPADPNVQDTACEVCRDKFEQFYNEEKDEWQLRMAIRVDDKTYHPLCYEDYQASLIDESLDETTVNENTESDSRIPGLEVTNDEVQKEESDVINADDDVMEVIENIDDEDTNVTGIDENKIEHVQIDDNEVEEDEDDDVIINEVVPEKIILDDDDKDDFTNNDDGLIPGVTVKIEPVDDGFVDVEGGLVKEKEIKIKTEPVDNDETETSCAEKTDAADTTHTAVVSSIDGNVEFETGNLASSGISAKIKINITKPLPSLVSKENKDVTEEEIKSNIDPSQPLPPGEEPIQLNTKPALQGLELKRQAVVKKGSELTGLCSIM